MRRLIEYTLISADGVFENPQGMGFMSLRDDAYLRDGLGLLLACDAMLMGRHMYETSASIWPSRTDPWAKRLNEMKKYVFSNTLSDAAWSNSQIVSGDAASAVAELKRTDGADLLIWGHTMLTETLWRHDLVDVLDPSVHPVIAGHGKLFFRDGLTASLRLVATKSFTNIVKLTYEPQR
jgi:dihydrofolate reductase